jgi:hypothetical protein
MSRLSLRLLLQGAASDALKECLTRWRPPADGEALPTGAALGRHVTQVVAAAMEDEVRVLERINLLPRKLQDLLDVFFKDGDVRELQPLFQEFGSNFKSRFDLEASLAALHREGFLWPVKDKRWATLGSACWAAPSELVECIRAYRNKRQRQLQDALTLQGFLEARYFRNRAENGKSGKAEGKTAEAKAADHARKIYKLYTLESAMSQRLEKLPTNVRSVVDAVLTRFGGLACLDDVVREVELKQAPDLELVGKVLEESMLGMATSLDLTRIGIQPVDRAVVVFHEVALWAIRRRGETQPPQVDTELVAGVDFATNVGRFLHELQDSKVLFTAEGDLFKASAKRIAGLLLPVPGNFVDAEAMLDLVYRFCLQRRLIDRRGERALRATPSGTAFDRAGLAEQTKQLLAHFVEDRTTPGEPYHHTRMRRVLLRLLRRAEPMVWQDVTVLPFLTRNAYLAQLDSGATEESFAARFRGGGYTPSESLQQMCWNLLIWIKKRLFPLGLVDIGMHGGRVTALRLSRLGAELLEAEPASKVGGTRCSVIVQPDFEVLVFPGDDVHDVVHLFDRFARRTKSDHVHQFRIDQDSFARGLADGLSGAAILQALTDRARAPIPQNVLYTIEEWSKPSP